MAACSPKNVQPEEPSCWRFCWRDQPGMLWKKRKKRKNKETSER
jgi:hypothetical protein